MLCFQGDLFGFWFVTSTSTFSLQTCSGTLLIPPSTGRTNIVHLLQPLDRKLTEFCNIFFLVWQIFFWYILRRRQAIVSPLSLKSSLLKWANSEGFKGLIHRIGHIMTMYLCWEMSPKSPKEAFTIVFFFKQNYTTFFCLSRFTMSDYAMKVVSCLGRQTGNTTRVIICCFHDVLHGHRDRSKVVAEAGQGVSIMVMCCTHN